MHFQEVQVSISRLGQSFASSSSSKNSSNLLVGKKGLKTIDRNNWMAKCFAFPILQARIHKMRTMETPLCCLDHGRRVILLLQQLQNQQFQLAQLQWLFRGGFLETRLWKHFPCGFELIQPFNISISPFSWDVLKTRLFCSFYSNLFTLTIRVAFGWVKWRVKGHGRTRGTESWGSYTFKQLHIQLFIHNRKQ